MEKRQKPHGFLQLLCAAADAFETLQIAFHGGHLAMLAPAMMGKCRENAGKMGIAWMNFAVFLGQTWDLYGFVIL